MANDYKGHIAQLNHETQKGNITLWYTEIMRV